MKTKLVIFPTTKLRQQLLETEEPIVIQYGLVGDEQTWVRTAEQLEDYGAAWSRFWNTDIVMLVEEDA